MYIFDIHHHHSLNFSDIYDWPSPLQSMCTMCVPMMSEYMVACTQFATPVAIGDRLAVSKIRSLCAIFPIMNGTVDALGHV